MGTIFSAFKIWVGLTPKPDISKILADDHAYKRIPESSRGPCPGLNMLANHGYLPRDGKGITHERLVAVLLAIKMSPVWATIISDGIIEGVGHDGKLDLTDLRKHDAFEHDASLTRLDFRQGDNYLCQPDMVQDLLKDAEGGPVTYQSIAKTRARRMKEAKKDNSVPSLYFQARAILEAASLIHFLGDGASEEDVHKFFLEERLPHPENPGAMRGTLWLNAVSLVKVWWFMRSSKGK